MRTEQCLVSSHRSARHGIRAFGVGCSRDLKVGSSAHACMSQPERGPACIVSERWAVSCGARAVAFSCIALNRLCRCSSRLTWQGRVACGVLGQHRHDASDVYLRAPLKGRKACTEVNAGKVFVFSHQLLATKVGGIGSCQRQTGLEPSNWESQRRKVFMLCVP